MSAFNALNRHYSEEVILHWGHSRKLVHKVLNKSASEPYLFTTMQFWIKQKP